MANDANTTGQKVLPKSREELRASVFSSERTKTIVESFKYNGADLEFRRPSIGQMTKLQTGDDDRDKNFVIVSLIAHTYIPGTNEKFFEDTDYEMMEAMPASVEWMEIVAMVTRGLSTNTLVEGKVKN